MEPDGTGPRLNRRIVERNGNKNLTPLRFTGFPATALRSARLGFFHFGELPVKRRKADSQDLSGFILVPSGLGQGPV